MTLTGSATAEGTARYRDRFKDKAASEHFRSAQKLWLSSIGIGTYLGNPDGHTDDLYVESIVSAVQNGANVIDSASNYRFQRSERAIGRALVELTANHNFTREEIVICTKGGYLPFDGEPPRDVRSYVQETFVTPGIARFEDIVGGSHCMTPSFLQNQLDQSLRNMDIECVDVYYIHNPESQLGYVSRNEFAKRLKTAFKLLEENRSAGKIQYYGVATWNAFRVAAHQQESHALSDMVEAAREVGGEGHGFRFVQLPFNLAMPEALTFNNQELNGERVSFLEAAELLGITVVSSASIFQGRVAHGLPETVREPMGRLATDAQTAIQFVRSAPGITTALVGMSRRAHVLENLALTEIEPAGMEQFMRLFSE